MIGDLSMLQDEAALGALVGKLRAVWDPVDAEQEYVTLADLDGLWSGCFLLGHAPSLTRRLTSVNTRCTVPRMTDQERLHVAHQPSDHLEVTDQGWLIGPGTEACPSARSSKLWVNETNILGIVWHYTDTRSATAMGLARRIMQMPGPGQRAASWHICIDRSGAIVQSISALLGSWHAGGASAARFVVDRFVEDARIDLASPPVKRRIWRAVSPHTGLPGANDLFLGIELENVGEVRRHGAEWLGWPFAHGTANGEPVVVPVDEIAKHTGRFYHQFTAAQVDAAQRVTQALVGKYHLVRPNCTLSHQAIDPERRTDPGPDWMDRCLPIILDQVFGGGASK